MFTRPAGAGVTVLGAGSIPITLHEAARSGSPRPGQSVLLIGSGGRMAVGMGLLRW